MSPSPRFTRRVDHRMSSSKFAPSAASPPSSSPNGCRSHSWPPLSSPRSGSSGLSHPTSESTPSLSELSPKSRCTTSGPRSSPWVPLSLPKIIVGVLSLVGVLVAKWRHALVAAMSGLMAVALAEHVHVAGGAVNGGFMGFKRGARRTGHLRGRSGSPTRAPRAPPHHLAFQLRDPQRPLPGPPVSPNGTSEPG